MCSDVKNICVPSLDICLLPLKGLLLRGVLLVLIFSLQDVFCANRLLRSHQLGGTLKVVDAVSAAQHTESTRKRMNDVQDYKVGYQVQSVASVRYSCSSIIQSYARSFFDCKMAVCSRTVHACSIKTKRMFKNCTQPVAIN